MRDLTIETAPRNPKERDEPQSPTTPILDLDAKRSARRQHLLRHLHAAGERPVMEACLELAEGRDFDEVLERFGRISVSVYRALGADRLPIDELIVIDGSAK